MKRTTLILSILLLLGSQVAFATITDNGDYTTVNDLDWLDLSMTAGLSVNDALLQNPDWSLATESQFSDMFTLLGGPVGDSTVHGESIGQYHNDPSGGTEQLSGGHASPLPFNGDYTSNSWSDLFGNTYERHPVALSQVDSFGLYLGDEGHLVFGGISAVDHNHTGGVSYFTSYYDHHGNQNLYYSEGHHIFGTFLVRNIPVPEPSVLLLLLLGLIGLVISRRTRI